MSINTTGDKLMISKSICECDNYQILESTSSWTVPWILIENQNKVTDCLGQIFKEKKRGLITWSQHAKVKKTYVPNLSSWGKDTMIIFNYK